MKQNIKWHDDPSIIPESEQGYCPAVCYLQQDVMGLWQYTVQRMQYPINSEQLATVQIRAGIGAGRNWYLALAYHGTDIRAGKGGAVPLVRVLHAVPSQVIINIAH